MEPFTPGYVARRAGINADLLLQAARTFGGMGKRGGAMTSTGPSMAPRSNLTEHLVECLNVVCGRFRRAGDRLTNPGVLSPRRVRRAQVIPPYRTWEHGPQTRIHGYGALYGEYPTSQFADQVLTPGEGRIRSLFVVGGNPASAIPDQRKVTTALRALDLLVTTDPMMSTTARLAHYVFAPKLHYERPSSAPTFWGDEYFLERPVAAYTPALVDPPPGSEVVDEWYVLWGLAKRMGLPLRLGEAAGFALPNSGPVPLLDMSRTPTSDELYEILLRDSAVPLDEVKRRRGELLDLEPQYVEPGDASSTAKFALMPDDVFDELAAVARENFIPGRTMLGGTVYNYRLTSRRMRAVSNSMYHDLDLIRERHRYNPAYIHPDDLKDLALNRGSEIEIVSEHASIVAVAEADASLRRGVVSMAHSWGGLPDQQDSSDAGSCTNLLISTERHLEPINAMPQMSAIPVNLRPRA